MNIDKKAGHIDPKVALSQAEHEKGAITRTTDWPLR